MATITLPLQLIENNQVISAIRETLNEGKFLPGYWVNHLPNGNLENLKFFLDGNLLKVIPILSYKDYMDALIAQEEIQSYIQSSDKEILTKVGRERNLVWFTYNFMKI